MPLDRRHFLETTGVALTAWSLFGPRLAAASSPPPKIGMCDWNLGPSCDPEQIPKAQEAHLEGLQVSVGIRPDFVPLREPVVRQRYLELGKQHGITFPSVAAGSLLNQIPLKSEPQSAVYVIDAVEAAAVLGSSCMVQVYYDVGNSTAYGYDVPGEIRMLGNDRICEIHLKETLGLDDPRAVVLGAPEAGGVDFEGVVAACRDIGFDNWYILELSGRKDQFIPDTRTNVAFVKKHFS